MSQFAMNLYFDKENNEVSGKSGCRDSLAPAFIYMILQERTNAKKTYTQDDIIRRLDEYPYEISLERRAVGRIVHALAGAGIGVNYSRTGGIWYQKPSSKTHNTAA